MGGFRSGRRGGRATKGLVEHCLVLDSQHWTHEGLLVPGHHRCGVYQWGKRSWVCFESQMTAGGPALRLMYFVRGGERLDYLVRLATTTPHFGGIRWWFLCPLVLNGNACSRRVGKLYLPPGANYFGCRHCHQLTYLSTRKSRAYERALRMAQSQREYCRRPGSGLHLDGGPDITE